MSKVTLDRDTFKALASETRLAILHALDERRKTGSELARELELNKATVHEHLQTLVATGLVTKKDEGRKWVYWELSWEGSKLLHPGQGAVFSVLLGLGILSTGGGITALGAALGWWFDTMPRDSGDTETAFVPQADENSSDDAEGDTAADEGGEQTAPAEGEEESAEEAQLEAGDDASMEAADESSGGLDGLSIGAIMLLLTALVALASAIWLRKRR